MQYGATGGGRAAVRDGRPAVDGCHPVDGCQDGTTFEGAKFQYLAATSIDKSTRKPLLPPYQIVNVDGVKMAFIGKTLEGTPLVVNPAGIAGSTSRTRRTRSTRSCRC